MNTYCGAHCENCPSQQKCKGCTATGGSPFGGRCVAAEYIKLGGEEAYRQFKEQLREEVNALLASRGIGQVECLYELLGFYVNLAYTLPSGEQVKLLSDQNVYLGAQIEFADQGLCYGVVADAGFILLCSYGKDGSESELLLYQKR